VLLNCADDSGVVDCVIINHNNLFLLSVVSLVDS